MPRVSFPDRFLWGTATAAHQIEGQNVNNDWWEYEHRESTPCVESSGDACDSWHRWRSDVELVASLGLGAYRFSLEWSRIEPAEGEWSAASLAHYRTMCAQCRDVGLVPVVTFHHFTIPTWLSRSGGWEREDSPERFAKFCEKACAHLGDLVGIACTLNEPNVVSYVGYRLGIFPPGVTDRDRSRRVTDALCRAHRLAVDVLRSGPGSFPAGLTLSMSDYQAVEGGDESLARIRLDAEDVFLESTQGDDFIGVQTYSRTRVGPEGPLGPEPGVRLTQMGYEFWPDALEATVRRATDVTQGTPVIVTENGIGTADDAERVEFVGKALEALKRCIDDGIEVQGYFYWSLLDNFEWVLGYVPTFGLVQVDRTTFERRLKPSATWFGEVAKSNAVET